MIPHMSKHYHVLLTPIVRYQNQIINTYLDYQNFRYQILDTKIILPKYRKPDIRVKLSNTRSPNTRIGLSEYQISK